MNVATAFRFVCVGLLWIFFCGWLIWSYQRTGIQLTLLNLFPIVASAIIVFVPMYKKYIKNAKGADKK